MFWGQCTLFGTNTLFALIVSFQTYAKYLMLVLQLFLIFGSFRIFVCIRCDNNLYNYQCRLLCSWYLIFLLVTILKYLVFMLIIMIALRVLFCEQTLWNFILIVRVLYISCIYVSDLDDGKHGRGNTFHLLKASTVLDI